METNLTFLSGRPIFKGVVLVVQYGLRTTGCGWCKGPFQQIVRFLGLKKWCFYIYIYRRCFFFLGGGGRLLKYFFKIIIFLDPCQGGIHHPKKVECKKIFWGVGHNYFRKFCHVRVVSEIITSKMKIPHHPPKIIFMRWDRVYEDQPKCWLPPTAPTDSPIFARKSRMINA